eukprot:11448424-Alexandrium_andersonii.AAC.1
MTAPRNHTFLHQPPRGIEKGGRDVLVAVQERVLHAAAGAKRARPDACRRLPHVGSPHTAPIWLGPAQQGAEALVRMLRLLRLLAHHLRLALAALAVLAHLR